MRRSTRWAGAYFKMGQYALAENNLVKASQHSSQDPTVHEHLGDLYEKTDRLQQAASQWGRVAQAGWGRPTRATWRQAKAHGCRRSWTRRECVWRAQTQAAASKRAASPHATLPVYPERMPFSLAFCAVSNDPNDPLATRAYPEFEHAYRSAFERDRARIIHARAFRRLAGKNPGLSQKAEVRASRRTISARA